MTIILYQGEPGAYSQKACIELLGEHVTTIGVNSFSAVFEGVEKGDGDYALVPIENSLGGSIHDNFDHLFRYNLHIIAEYNLRVRHCLVALKGVTKNEILLVKSHPQALAQCDEYIRKWGVKQEASYDTAGTAKMIKEKGDKTTAAICSSIAASIYNLQILDSGIEDDENNFTRFLLLSRTPVYPPINISAKTSIVFSMKNTNEPAALFKALSVFALRDLNLSKIESRPIKPDVLKDCIQRYRKAEAATVTEDDGVIVNASKFKYMFYCDVLASMSLEASRKAIGHLEEIASFVRVLGSFPTDGVLIGSVVNDIMSPTSGTPLHEGLKSPLGRGGESSPATLLNVGIYGFGRFGQFLAKTFTKYCKVFVYNRENERTIAESLGVQYCDSVEELTSNNLDVLLLSVSVLSFQSVVEALPKHKIRNILVVDVLSVKMHAKDVLKDKLPLDCDILCTHPMFGPDSGKYSWKKLPFVYDVVRVINTQRLETFLNIFQSENCKMVEMTCEAHDAYAAGSQFITHFTGRMLGDLKLNHKLSTTPINTRGFETLLELVDNTCRDSFDLFYALYKYNSNSREQLVSLNESVGNVIQALKNFERRTEAGNRDGGKRILDINSRVADIAPSKTVYLAAKVSELERAGHIIYSLAVGEPDFQPHPSILEAVTEAMRSGKTGYTNVSGIFELRKEIADYLFIHKSIKYSPDQILCTSGAKQGVYMAVNCLVRPRDEVIIPAPFWVSYPDIVRLCGGSPVILDTYVKDGYLINAESLNALISPRTRMLILCNPSNPTGAMQPKETLEAIAEVLRRPENQHVFVLADEIYERISFDVPHVSFASLPGMYDRTITINGMSKAYGMTGFRLGFMAAPSDIIDPCRKILSQTTHAPNTMAQYAGIAALKLPASVIEEYVKVFRSKRDYVLSRLLNINGIESITPEGAFYILPSVSSLLGKRCGTDNIKVSDATEFCMQLLKLHNVALTTGDAFGAPGTIRISYAASMETLKGAMDGIELFCNSFHV